MPASVQTCALCVDAVSRIVATGGTLNRDCPECGARYRIDLPLKGGRKVSLRAIEFEAAQVERQALREFADRESEDG